MLTKQRMRMAKVVSAAATMAMVFQPMAVFAVGGPLGDDPTSVIGQLVNAGALTIEAPADMTMPQITVLTNAQTVGYQNGDSLSGNVGNNGTAPNIYKELEDFKVDDARGNKNDPGWSATVTATDFSDGGTPESVIDLTNIKLYPNDNEVFKDGAYVSEDFPVSAGDISLGSEEQLADAEDDGVSDAKTVATAASGNGRGRFQMDVGFQLEVPPNPDATNYSSTFTFTIS